MTQAPNENEHTDIACNYRALPVGCPGCICVRKTEATPDELEITDLADAVWQVLDDMGKTGHSCCGLAKAKLRLAFEPFRDTDDGVAPNFTVEDAEAIVRECEQ